MNAYHPPLTLVVCCALAILPALTVPAQDPAKPPAKPYATIPHVPPDKASATFHTLDGFTMELIAAEPLVTDPVAIAYDESGRAYVAEMNDYPYTDKAAHKPSQENPSDKNIGKIRLLTDTDNDGVFDKATVFAAGLSWPTGVACWKGGVYVTATPDIWYLKDSTGDGVADIRQKVYSGLRKYNVQAVTNTPVWGLDNRIHIAGSSNGGVLQKLKPDGSPDTSAEPIHMRRHDLRLDPRDNGLELQSGGARFGGSFDDYGNRFLCNIRNPAQHVVIALRHLERNPFVPLASPLHDAAEAGANLTVYPTSPVEKWRAERAERWSATEVGKHPASELRPAGAVTSSSGITVYRGDAWPEKYRGQIFVADVASNVFYRLAVAADGPTFKATRGDDQVDFVTSEDNWFRPASFVNAPDGCLHVLDMYREGIEHPWSIPDDIHARIDLENGRDRGRIFRLAPPGFKRRPTPDLGKLPSADLVPLLAHSNAWHRETAQRLLFERQDQSVIPALEKLLRQSPSVLGRIHALHTLDGLDALTGEDVHLALADKSPRVREQGIPLAAKTNVSLPPALASDADTRIRFQTALALGDSPNAKATEMLSIIARKDGGDPWMRTAILTSAKDHAAGLASTLIRENSPHSELVRLLGITVGAQNIKAQVGALFQSIDQADAHPAIQIAAVAGLADGLARKKQQVFASATAHHLADGFRARILAHARQVAADEQQSLELRSTALGLYRYAAFEEAAPIYTALLKPGVPAELQAAALKSYAAFTQNEVAKGILAAWPQISPSLRQQALEALLTRPERIAPLLDAIADGTVSTHLVTKARRDALLNSPDAKISAKAKDLFAASGRPRNEVVTQYSQAMEKLNGDPTAGKTVYMQVCMACHKNGEQGFAELGPNLATVAAWDRDQLLTNILDPNREVSPNYIEYLVELKDGSTLSGAIVNETSNAIILRRPDASRQYIVRRDIKKLNNTNLSLMPEGLEGALPPQKMADLVSYLLSK